MTSRRDTLSDAAYWYVSLGRALPAAVLAIAITFTADHSPALGYLAFGIFAVLTGVFVGVSSYRTLTDRIARRVFVAQGVITLLAGVLALVRPGAGLGFLLFLLSTWAALAGFLELYAGIRARGRHAASRDWIFIGGLTVLFALAVLVVPPDLRQQFTGPDDVARVLNTSIVVVGALGAYGAIAAVYLVIAGISLRWPTAAPASKDGHAS